MLNFKRKLVDPSSFIDKEVFMKELLNGARAQDNLCYALTAVLSEHLLIQERLMPHLAPNL
jgi:hypothetical protein